MDDEFEVLKQLHDAGVSFEQAYGEVFEDDAAYLVEAYEMWQDWEAGEP